MKYLLMPLVLSLLGSICHAGIVEETCSRFSKEQLTCDYPCRVGYLEKIKAPAIAVMTDSAERDETFQKCFRSNGGPGCEIMENVNGKMKTVKVDREYVKTRLFGPKDEREKNFKEMRKSLALRSNENEFGAAVGDWNMFAQDDRSKAEQKVRKNVAHPASDGAKLKPLTDPELEEAAEIWDTEFATLFYDFAKKNPGDECSQLYKFRSSKRGDVQVSLRKKGDKAYTDLLNRHPLYRYISDPDNFDEEVPAILAKVSKNNKDVSKKFGSYQPSKRGPFDSTKAFTLHAMGTERYFADIAKASAHVGATGQKAFNDKVVLEACRGAVEMNRLVVSSEAWKQNTFMVSAVAGGIGFVAAAGCGLVAGAATAGTAALPAAAYCGGTAGAAITGSLMLGGAAVGTVNAVGYGVAESNQIRDVTQVTGASSQSELMDQSELGKLQAKKNDSVEQGVLNSTGLVGGGVVSQGKGAIQLGATVRSAGAAAGRSLRETGTSVLESARGGPVAEVRSMEATARKQVAETAPALQKMSEAEIAEVHTAAILPAEREAHDLYVARLREESVARKVEPLKPDPREIKQYDDLLSEYQAKSLAELTESPSFQKMASERGYKIVQEPPSARTRQTRSVNSAKPPKLILLQNVNQASDFVHPSLLRRENPGVAQAVGAILTSMKRGASPREVWRAGHNAEMKALLPEIAPVYARKFPNKVLADQPIEKVYSDVGKIRADESFMKSLSADEAVRLKQFTAFDGVVSENSQILNQAARPQATISRVYSAVTGAPASRARSSARRPSQAENLAERKAVEMIGKKQGGLVSSRDMLAAEETLEKLGFVAKGLERKVARKRGYELKPKRLSAEERRELGARKLAGNLGEWLRNRQRRALQSPKDKPPGKPLRLVVDESRFSDSRFNQTPALFDQADNTVYLRPSTLKLSESELKGIIAHELDHATNVRLCNNFGGAYCARLIEIDSVGGSKIGIRGAYDEGFYSEEYNAWRAQSRFDKGEEIDAASMSREFAQTQAGYLRLARDRVDKKIAGMELELEKINVRVKLPDGRWLSVKFPFNRKFTNKAAARDEVLKLLDARIRALDPKGAGGVVGSIDVGAPIAKAELQSWFFGSKQGTGNVPKPSKAKRAVAETQRNTLVTGAPDEVVMRGLSDVRESLVGLTSNPSNTAGLQSSLLTRYKERLEALGYEGRLVEVPAQTVNGIVVPKRQVLQFTTISNPGFSLVKLATRFEFDPAFLAAAGKSAYFERSKGTLSLAHPYLGPRSAEFYDVLREVRRASSQRKFIDQTNQGSYAQDLQRYLDGLNGNPREAQWNSIPYVIPLSLDEIADLRLAGIDIPTESISRALRQERNAEKIATFLKESPYDSEFKGKMLSFVQRAQPEISVPVVADDLKTVVVPVNREISKSTIALVRTKLTRQISKYNRDRGVPTFRVSGNQIPFAKPPYATTLSLDDIEAGFKSIGHRLKTGDSATLRASKDLIDEELRITLSSVKAYREAIAAIESISRAGDDSLKEFLVARSGEDYYSYLSATFRMKLHRQKIDIDLDIPGLKPSSSPEEIRQALQKFLTRLDGAVPDERKLRQLVDARNAAFPESPRPFDSLLNEAGVSSGDLAKRTMSKDSEVYLPDYGIYREAQDPRLNFLASAGLSTPAQVEFVESIGNDLRTAARAIKEKDYAKVEAAFAKLKAAVSPYVKVVEFQPKENPRNISAAESFFSAAYRDFAEDTSKAFYSPIDRVVSVPLQTKATAADPELAELYKRSWALVQLEEYGHLVQTIREETGQGYALSRFVGENREVQKGLSEITRTSFAGVTSGNILLIRKINLELETDIYAFMIEEVGVDMIPRSVGTSSGYSTRSVVDAAMRDGEKSWLRALRNPEFVQAAAAHSYSRARSVISSYLKPLEDRY